MTVFVKKPLTVAKLANSFGVQTEELIKELQELKHYLSAEDGLEDAVAKEVAAKKKIDLVILG